MKLIYKLEELDNSNVREVGGKNASLGEMFQQLSSKGINIPDGFATSADSYWKFIRENEIEEKLSDLLTSVKADDSEELKKTGEKCRNLVLQASIPGDIEKAILKSYKELKKREKALESVAVRSSATAEDLPDASFAGQHETYLNIKNEDELLEAWKKCVASLFTDRAIKYREENGFEHMKVALSVGVQKMVRADKASAGVAFTIDPDSGFENVILINGVWGLGENVVQGTVRNDEFYLFKEALKNDHDPILSKKLGSKRKMMVFEKENKSGETTKNKRTPVKTRKKYVLTDEELIQLGKWCLEIEKHYDKAMDIEWAKDGNSGELYIVQARPETVHSAKEKTSKLKNFSLKR